jgi:predicted MFS family arabinose efflux permease
LGQGPIKGWGSAGVVFAGASGVVAFAALVLVELRTRYPMLHLRLLGNRLFRATNVAALFGYGSFIGFLFLMPLFLQEARGLSALDSGLTTFPEAIGVLVSSQIVGRIYGTIGPRRLMAGGLTAVACTLAVGSLLELDTNLWLVRLLMFVTGAGMAFVFVPLQAATFATITPADTGQASAIFSTQRQVAAALGVAILATVLSVRLPGGDVVAGTDQVSAFHGAFLVGGALALIGALASLVIRDSDAAPTMRPRQASAADPVPLAVTD